LLQPCTTGSSSSSANTCSSAPPSPVSPFLLYYLLYKVHFYICFAQKRLPMASRLTMCLNHFKCACVYQKTVVLQVENKSHNGCKRLCVYYSSFHFLPRGEVKYFNGVTTYQGKFWQNVRTNLWFPKNGTIFMTIVIFFK
jgi:hypothetical protein